VELPGVPYDPVLPPLLLTAAIIPFLYPHIHEGLLRLPARNRIPRSPHPRKAP
jgi:hypothetical protein